MKKNRFFSSFIPNKCYRKIYLWVVAVYLCISGSAAQAQVFSYNDYLNYRYNHYLAVPLPLMREASGAMEQGDTASAISLIKQAINNGLYEPIRLNKNSQLEALKTRPVWKEFMEGIELNRKKYSDPARINIYTNDLTNFFNILDSVSRPTASKIFLEQYFLKGSPGLKAFFDLKLGGKPDGMIQKIRRMTAFYNSIAPIAGDINFLLPEIKRAVQKLEDYYPEAIFPPLYFLIGVFNVGGTPDIGNGLLIGCEFFSRSPVTPLSELNETERFALYDTSRVLPVVIHELIHVEQKNPWGSNLLEQCIIEGACDFISSIVLDKNPNPKMHLYGDAHEQELWEKFKKEFESTDYSYWLYNSVNQKSNLPANLGYYIGFKICESYYLRNGKNKNKAIRDIIEINDFKSFLSLSGYESKFT